MTRPPPRSTPFPTRRSSDLRTGRLEERGLPADRRDRFAAGPWRVQGGEVELAVLRDREGLLVPLLPLLRSLRESHVLPRCPALAAAAGDLETPGRAVPPRPPRRRTRRSIRKLGTPGERATRREDVALTTPTRQGTSAPSGWLPLRTPTTRSTDLHHAHSVQYQQHLDGYRERRRARRSASSRTSRQVRGPADATGSAFRGYQRAEGRRRHSLHDRSASSQWGSPHRHCRSRRPRRSGARSLEQDALAARHAFRQDGSTTGLAPTPATRPDRSGEPSKEMPL